MAALDQRIWLMAVMFCIMVALLIVWFVFVRNKPNCTLTLEDTGFRVDRDRASSLSGTSSESFSWADFSYVSDRQISQLRTNLVYLGIHLKNDRKLEFVMPGAYENPEELKAIQTDIAQRVKAYQPAKATV